MWTSDSYLCVKSQDLLPSLVEMTERIAQTVGMDYVRVDFFAGGPDGLILNEVTYQGMYRCAQQC